MTYRQRRAVALRRPRGTLEDYARISAEAKARKGGEVMHGNSGPAREVWGVGDRVRLVRTEHAGTVATPPLDQERTAFQTGFVWVRWDDIEATWADPNSLDVADVG